MTTAIIRLNYGIRLELRDGVPISVTAADGKNWSYQVTKVSRFRYWFGRWCVGDLELEDAAGKKRTLHFINANPILGFLLAWDDPRKMWEDVAHRWNNMFSANHQH